MHEIRRVIKIKEPDDKLSYTLCTEVTAAGEPAGSVYLTQFSMGKFSICDALEQQSNVSSKFISAFKQVSIQVVRKWQTKNLFEKAK